MDAILFQRTATAIIADWRAVARDLRVVPEGTPEAAHLHAEGERLRVEYHDLTEEAVAAHQPHLPPFPATADPGN